MTLKGDRSTAKNLMKPIASDSGIIVGVTGGIACGKSTVSKLLSKKGAIPINSDEIGHQLLKRGSPVMSALLEAFGTDILDESGDVNRQKLATIVFNDKAARERLNAIMHPPIVERSRSEAKRLVTEDANCVVLIDAPLLIETNSQDTVDIIVVVTASTQTQLQRLLERAIKQNRPPSQAEAQARIDSQMPLSEKIKYADFVLENDGTFEELEEKAESLWHEIRRLQAN
jgi:dephospho-CoA kinase